MSARHVLEIFLVTLSIISLNVCAQEGDVCIIPGGLGESTCIRLHRCDVFNKIVIKYSGRPPQIEIDYIMEHSCGKNQLVCCPDGAKPIPSTTTKTTTTSTTTTATHQPVVDIKPNALVISEIKNHRNIGLLNQKCGSSTSDRIVNGSKAKPGQFPWMALLQYNLLGDQLTFNCGGTLISKSYVLTAAHCIIKSLVAVRLGEHDLNTNPDCVTYEDPHEVVCQDPVQDIPIEKKIKHTLFDNKLKVNDIALLRLQTPADTTKRNVKTICLPITEENQIDKLAVDSQKNMFISGWGKTENGNPSDILMKAQVPYVKNSVCRQKFAPLGLNIPVTFLCAGGDNKTDTCHGDSGGPIQTLGYLNGAPKTFLYGVVSVGIDCLNPTLIYPGIYTNIAYYIEWILENMTQ